jgi:hypothetical protein
MREKLPNFIYGAIYRARSGADPNASSPRFNCYMPAGPDIPTNAWIADCWVCDAFGRIDPGLNVSPVPVRKEDLGPVINTIHQSQRL